MYLWSVLIANKSPLPVGLSGYKDSSHGIAESASLRPQWCCHCKVVILGSGVRKSFKDLTFVNKVLYSSSNDPPTSMLLAVTPVTEQSALWGTIYNYTISILGVFSFKPNSYNTLLNCSLMRNTFFKCSEI